MCKRRLGVSSLRGYTSGVPHANSAGLILALICNYLSGIIVTITIVTIATITILPLL